MDFTAITSAYRHITMNPILCFICTLKIALLCNFIASVKNSCRAFEQELELYTEVDQGGNALLLRDKVANLLDISPAIVNNVKSFCVQGRWRIFPKKDFVFDNFTELLAFSTKSFKCHNSGLGNTTGSARFLGTNDTDTESISFYSEKNQLGSEVVVEVSSLAEIPFPVHSLITMGQSSWTVFAENNFKGNATCYKSVKKVTVSNSIDFAIRSVKKDCGSDITNVVILDDAKSAILAQMGIDGNVSADN